MLGILSWRAEMIRFRIRVQALLIASFMLMLIPLGVRAYSAVTSPPQRTALSGHLVPALKGLHPLAATSPQRVLALSVGMQLRNQSALQTLLKAQDTRTSGLFHHYLTPQSFAAEFGPLPANTQKVSTYLVSVGFHVTSIAANHALIFVSGTVATTEHAFAITLDDYFYDGNRVFAPINEPSVPTDLAAVIQGIGGLDDVGKIHHTHAHSPAVHHLATAETPATSCTTAGGYGPDDWRALYDITPLVNNGYDGTGQAIAIVEFDGYMSADIATFDSCYNLPMADPITQYVAPGAYTSPKTIGGSIEADLDMEVTHEIAPGAQELLYLGANQGIVMGSILPDIQDIIPVYNQISADNLATIVSVSYDLGCEETEVSDYQLKELDVLLTQATAQGITFSVAAGDSGSYGCVQNGNIGYTEISALVADPHVLAIGGTSFNNPPGTPRDAQYPETYWTSPSITGGNNDGGGYGTSIVFSAPYYEPYLAGGMRTIPDVSAEADSDSGLNSGYAEYCNFPVGCGGWLINGGTSAAAPLWAGILADTNTYLAALQLPTLGVANALLYSIAYNQYPYAPYYDVTLGCYSTYGNNQSCSETTQCPQPYPQNCAHPRFDGVTGLGTPDAWNMARDVADQIETNIESDVVWGTANGATNDLFASSYTPIGGGAKTWQAENVSQFICTLHSNDPTAFQPFSLVPNMGRPGVVSYQTSGDGAEVDAFFLVSLYGSTYLYGVTYLPATGSWSDIGMIDGGPDSLADLPVYNPTPIAIGTPTNRAVALFGINASGHLFEWYLNNSDREQGGVSTQAWNGTDISLQTGVTCDTGIAPTAINYRGVAIAFADCGGELLDFYTNNAGDWVANQNITGHSIPNASHAFPGRSIATMMVPGNPPALEAYVASDANGVKAVTEYLYNGSTWAAYTLPASGYTPDQVYAQTVAVNPQGVGISELIVSAPAAASCGSTPPAAIQYLYQSGWHTKILPQPGVTSMVALADTAGTETDAYTGNYTGPSTIGAHGGQGCGAREPLLDETSLLAAGTWSSTTIEPAAINPEILDTIGVDPAGVTLPY
jgi:hypothetical protein